MSETISRQPLTGTCRVNMACGDVSRLPSADGREGGYQDRPGTDSVTVIYECLICKTETHRHHKGASPMKAADPSGSSMI